MLAEQAPLTVLQHNHLRKPVQEDTAIQIYEEQPYVETQIIILELCM